MVSYEVYLAIFLNLELEFMERDNLPDAKSYLEKRALDMILENTDLSCVFDQTNSD